MSKWDAETLLVVQPACRSLAWRMSNTILPEYQLKLTISYRLLTLAYSTLQQTAELHCAQLTYTLVTCFNKHIVLCLYLFQPITVTGHGQARRKNGSILIRGEPLVVNASIPMLEFQLELRPLSYGATTIIQIQRIGCAAGRACESVLYCCSLRTRTDPKESLDWPCSNGRKSATRCELSQIESSSRFVRY